MLRFFATHSKTVKTACSNLANEKFGGIFTNPEVRSCSFVETGTGTAREGLV